MNLALIPTGLVLLRFLISPFLVWDALDGETSVWFIVAYVTAFLSDIFDGLIARWLDVRTPQLRQADHRADLCLFVCTATSAWLAHQDIIVACRLPLLILAFAQIMWWIVSLVKYGKPASYYTYSARFWGLTVFIAIVFLFGSDFAEIPLWLSCVVGIIFSVEEIAMTLILPIWTEDVFSIFHALKLRGELKAIS